MLALFAPLAIPLAVVLYSVFRVASRRKPVSVVEVIAMAGVAFLAIVVVRWKYFSAYWSLTTAVSLIAIVCIPLAIATFVANAMVRREETNVAILLVALPAGWGAALLLPIIGLYLSCTIAHDCL